MNDDKLKTIGIILLFITLILVIFMITKPMVKKNHKISMYSKTYCDGWKKGYSEGYCYNVANCIEPIAPICPIPKIGFDKYKDGYNRGFSKGKKDKSNE